MKCLLDTHVFLWWLFDDARLRTDMRGIIAEPTNTVFISSASAWEITTKYRLGKLDAAKVLVQDISGYVTKAGFTELPITIAHAERAGSWTHDHRDPFDRMLAAQAAIEELTLITGDRVLHQFGVKTLWSL